MRPHGLRHVPILLLALLLMGAPAFAGPPESDGAKAYARELLVREARRMARPDAVVATDLEALTAALSQDLKLRAGWQATSAEQRTLLEAWDETIAARRLLLGEPQTVDAEGRPVAAMEGALADARDLLRWLLADVPEHTDCGVSIHVAGAPADESRDFTYPLLPAAPAAPQGGVPADGGKPPAPPAGNGKPPAPVPDGVSAPPPAAPAPQGTATLEVWARAVRIAVGGTLVGKEIEPAVCTVVDRLRAAATTPTPLQGDASAPGLKLERHALETDDPFAYNAAFVALRRIQAAERVEAFRADRPAQGLVDDGTLREKTQRAEAFAKSLEELEKQRNEVLARLDAMAGALDSWKTMAAILSVRIEDRRAELEAAAPAAGPAAAPPDLALRVFSAQETLIALEMRLLYLAAVRSDVRLGLLREKADTSSGLLEQLIQATRDELAAAQATRGLYEEELARLRRERRLDKLQSEERRLAGRMADMDGAENATGTAALRMAAYKALLEVNAVVQEAVRRRRALGDWATQLAVNAPTEARGDDAVAFARDPGGAAWDATTLSRWRELLARPAFDAELVAEHYAVGERRLKRLRDTVRAAVNGGALQERFDATAETAKRALAPLTERRDWALKTDRLAELLEGWRRDFDDSFKGMEKEKERIAARQAIIRSYQEALLDLGTRSFSIRVVSDLDAGDLAAAASDTLDGLERSRDWLLVAEPERNAWQFARDHWLGVLIVVATILGVFFGTPRVRHVIERWLAKRAKRVPNLRWSDASVSGERQEAKARKEQEERVAAELRRSVEAETPGATAAPTPAPPPAAVAAAAAAAAAPAPDGPPRAGPPDADEDDQDSTAESRDETPEEGAKQGTGVRS